MDGREDKVWFVPFGTEDLVSAYDPYPPGATADNAMPTVAAAQAFTVSLRAIVVEADPERESWLHKGLFGDNDVLVLSRAALGTRPSLTRVHYYHTNLPVRERVDNLLADTIYLCEDYSGQDHLWLQVQVLEVGTNPTQRQELLSTFNGLANEAGSIFPAALPYTMAANLLATAVTKFTTAVTKNEPLLECPVVLDPRGEGSAAAR